MNNGVNNSQINTNTNTNSQPSLAPMTGVTVAPVQSVPVDVSLSSNLTNNVPQQTVAPVNTIPNVISPTVPSNSNLMEPQMVSPSNNISPTIVPSVASSNTNNAVTPVVIGNAPIMNPNSIRSNVTIPGGENVGSNKEKKKINIFPLLIFCIILLSFLCIYFHISHQKEMEGLRYNCTPLTSSAEEIELDKNSTLVQDLYNKVSTNIREDYVGGVGLTPSMKLYLAYRQILDKDKYDSNCNLFSSTSSSYFIPKAFKEETLRQEYKKLFGEGSTLPLDNIQFDRSCLVGYQYISARGEYVEGYCNQKTATSYKVSKEISKATSFRNTIILTEEVKYYETEGVNLPTYLKSGTYVYTFRLDMNYNYVLVSKNYEGKY